MNDHREDEALDLSGDESGWKQIVLNSELFINIKDPSEVCLTNLSTGYIERNISEIGIKKLLTREETASFYHMSVRVAQFIYDPHASGPLTKSIEGGEQLNLYQPPAWKKDSYFKHTELPPAPSALPSLYERYFTHLTAGDAGSMTYLLDWLSNSLRGRNFTILTAIGEPGIGKGVLGEIMSGLVGQSNFSRVRDSIFKKQFNGPLRFKQIIYVDEVAITTNEEADRVKDVVNERLEIERKGKDAEETDNHASFYLTSNRMDAVKIESSDRRFSIIQLTDTPLLKVFPARDIQELSKPANLQELALYLNSRTITSNLMKPFRSERFDDVLEAGLSEWELYLAESFFPSKEVGSEIPMTMISDDLKANFPYMKRAPGRHKLEGFARKYPEFLKPIRIDGVRKVQVIGKFQVKK